MPIYAYRCEGCGFQKDALQKLSDPPLVDCPQCGQPKLAKQVTAAGFALKGTGWYVTDFREGSKKPSGGAPASADAASSPPSSGAADSGAASASTSASTSASASGSASGAGASSSTAAASPSPVPPSTSAA